MKYEWMDDGYDPHAQSFHRNFERVMMKRVLVPTLVLSLGFAVSQSCFGQISEHDKARLRAFEKELESEGLLADSENAQRSRSGTSDKVAASKFRKIQSRILRQLLIDSRSNRITARVDGSGADVLISITRDYLSDTGKRQEPKQLSEVLGLRVRFDFDGTRFQLASVEKQSVPTIESRDDRNRRLRYERNANQAIQDQANRIYRSGELRNRLNGQSTTRGNDAHALVAGDMAQSSVRTTPNLRPTADAILAGRIRDGWQRAGESDKHYKLLYKFAPKKRVD